MKKQPRNQSAPRGTDADEPVRFSIGTFKMPRTDKQQQAKQEWRKTSIWAKELDG